MQSPRSSTPTTLAFHASRIVIDLGVLLAMASLSLDFVNSPLGNRSALEGDAVPALILLLPIFLITLLPDHTSPLPRPLSWASLVLGLAAFPYAIVKHMDAAVLADTLGGSVGIGARLLVFGTFVTLVGIAIGLTRSFLGLPTGANPAHRTRPETTRPQPPAQPRSTEAATVMMPPSDPDVPQDDPVAAPPAIPASPSPGPTEPASPRRPAKSEPESSPFGEPLFDSLEIPAFMESTDRGRESTLTFDAEAATDRVVEDDSDRSSED